MTTEMQRNALETLYEKVLLAFEEALDKAEDLPSLEPGSHLRKVKIWLENATSSLISWGIDARTDVGSLSAVEGDPLENELRCILFELQGQLEEYKGCQFQEKVRSPPEHVTSVVPESPTLYRDGLTADEDPMAIMSSLISVLQDTVRPIRMIHALRKQKGPYQDLKRQIDDVYTQRIEQRDRNELQEPDNLPDIALVENDPSREPVNVKDILLNQIETSISSQPTSIMPPSLGGDLHTQFDLHLESPPRTPENPKSEWKSAHIVDFKPNPTAVLQSTYSRPSIIQGQAAEESGPRATADLRTAIQGYQKAVDTTPADHPERANRFQSLGMGYYVKHQRTGAMADLETAIQQYQEALDITSADHPERVNRFQSLGAGYRDRYQRTGVITDLETAIQVFQKALDATPADHPDRTSRLRDLGHGYGDRYRRTGAMTDLETAIQQFQEALDITSTNQAAVDLTPIDNPNRARYLNSLGYYLITRYEREKKLEDLTQAIEYSQKAVDLTPIDNSNRATYLNSLSYCLSTRYEREEKLEDLTQAIEHGEKTVDLTSIDNPNRAVYVNNLSYYLLTRYRREEKIEDLTQAIEYSQEAVAIDSPNRAIYLNNLNGLLRRNPGNRASNTNQETNAAISHVAVGVGVAVAASNLCILM